MTRERIQPKWTENTKIGIDLSKTTIYPASLIFKMENTNLGHILKFLRTTDHTQTVDL